jgi:hypothetical protein
VISLAVQFSCLIGYIKVTNHPYLDIMFKFAFTLANVPPPAVIKHSLDYVVVQSPDEILSSRELHLP